MQIAISAVILDDQGRGGDKMPPVVLTGIGPAILAHLRDALAKASDVKESLPVSAAVSLPLGTRPINVYTKLDPPFPEAPYQV